VVAAPVVPVAPEPVTPVPVADEDAGRQTPDEVIGSYRCEDPAAVVVAINADGSWDCQVQS
jgi:hypothetical protein